jgi:hypothetical protein
MKNTRVRNALATLLAASCSLSLARLTASVAIPAASCRADTTGPGATAVRWSVPTDAANRARLDSWCAGVGPILFRSGVSSRVTTDEPRLEDIAFATWNVHVGSADIDRFVRDLRSGRLTNGRRPTHVVLMVQEAVRSEGVPRAVPAGALVAGWIGSNESVRRSEIGVVATLLDMSVLYAPSMRNGSTSDSPVPADRGNAILSTLPLSAPSAIELPGGRQRRVAVTAAVTVSAGGVPMPISIGAAHLDTMGTAKTLWVFGASSMRAAQAQALMSAAPEGPMILGADLNSWLGPQEPAPQTLLRFFPSTPSGRREPTFAAGLILDYMFFRAPKGFRARIERASERYGSDHYPLIGWLDHAGARGLAPVGVR